MITSWFGSNDAKNEDGVTEKTKVEAKVGEYKNKVTDIDASATILDSNISHITRPGSRYIDATTISTAANVNVNASTVLPPVNRRLPLRDIIAHLRPKRTPSKYEREDRSRFSSLLLEHGETPVDSWAVVLHSNPARDESSSNLRLQDKDGSLRRTLSPVSSIQWEQAPLRAQVTKPIRSTSTNAQNGQYYGKSSDDPALTSSSPSPAFRDKDAYPSLHWRKCEGRLYLCTHSLVFEPIDTSSGGTSRKLLRCAFNRMDSPPREYPRESTFESMSIEFTSSKHIVINPRSQAPFETIDCPGYFCVTFLHSPPSPFVNLCQQLWQIANDKSYTPTTTESSLTLESLLQPLWHRSFDLSNLVDIRETLLTHHIPCRVLRPLQSQPGVLVLTPQRLYIQPAAGVLSQSEARAWWYPLTDLVATARRYSGLRDCAIELYWKDETSTLVALERRHDREIIMRHLSSTTCVTDREFVVEVSQAWYSKKLSNYEYIMAINSAAGRSFQDMSRYPVFPWVISDYESTKLDLTNPATFRDLSKPIGALNPQRLEYFLKRLHNMPEIDQERFLYGTHYSAPGYVLYYLVRSMPELMLCLQNGKFDSPDRLFYSVANCYKCALSNHADVKELIPEFYHSSEYDFLINAKGLQLGATQNGDRVNDVQLPPWARSPRDFLKKNCRALESAYVTEHLPLWLDLIFGAKSRGEAALQANNLFHPITYLGPSQLASMSTPEERSQAELQANEFGIVPDQIFTDPHPVVKVDQKTTFSDSFISSDVGRASASKEDSTREAWELLEPPSSQDDGASVEGSLINDGNTTNSTGENNVGQASSYERDSAEGQRSKTSSLLSSTVESAPLTSPGALTTAVAVPTIESTYSKDASVDSAVNAAVFEHSVSVWDMKVIERRRIHNDTVSGCVLLINSDDLNKSMVATSSLDGGLLVHHIALAGSTGLTDNISLGGIGGFSTTFRLPSIISRSQVLSSASTTTSTAVSKLTEYRTHTARDPLASLTVTTDGAGGYIALAGGHDDVVLAYGVNSACAVASVYSHRDAVTGLDLVTRPPLNTTPSTLWPKGSTHAMISGSWDATVKVWSATVSTGEDVKIGREPLAELFDTDSSIVCVSAVNNPSGGILIGAGCTDGSFCVWDVHDDGVQVVLHKEAARRGSGSCSTMQWVLQQGHLRFFAGFSTGKIASYVLNGDDGKVKRSSAVSVGVAVLSLVYTQGILLIGCSDGGLRLLSVQKDGNFDSKPTLWPAVNGKASPGITSISVGYTQPSAESPTSQCICCTGSSDGSVAVFELKKI